MEGERERESICAPHQESISLNHIVCIWSMSGSKGENTSYVLEVEGANILLSIRGICEILYIEEGRKHFPLIVLFCPYMQNTNYNVYYNVY